MRNLEARAGMFAVLENGQGLQTAVMRLAPGGESGQLGNEHPDSEQVLFIMLDGIVEATVGDRRFEMRAGDSIIVEKNVSHRFVNRSQMTATTFNVYAPI